MWRDLPPGTYTPAKRLIHWRTMHEFFGWVVLIGRLGPPNEAEGAAPTTPPSTPTAPSPDKEKGSSA